MAEIVILPRQGQSVESCILNEWKVAEGDSVSEGDIIAVVETDKANFDVEATASGTILKLLAAIDDDVPVLDPLAVIGEPGEAIPDDLGGAQAEDAPSPSEENAPETSTSAPVTSVTPIPTGGNSGAVSPRARRAATEKGLDASGLAGSGPGGRVIERDVHSAIASGQPLSPLAKDKALKESLSAPSTGSGIGGRVLSGDLGFTTPIATGCPAPATGEALEIPVKGIRKVVAERMMASLSGAAQLTLSASADATSILAYRKKLKASDQSLGLNGVSINDLVLFAVAKVLPDFPELNAHFLGDKILQFPQIDLGFAVDTPKGLLVPVIRSANLRTLGGLSAESKRLASQSIEGKATPDDLTGGTFTVTNLGAMGIESFTPVLNTPQVGILGVCAVQPKPVMKGDDVAFIPHMGLSLTFDHQALDGAPAARFLKAVANAISNIELTLAR
jgi:pyruvate dehydrogenase E2 component (dihydrolipoamide acetyltransferase)